MSNDWSFVILQKNGLYVNQENGERLKYWEVPVM